MMRIADLLNDIGEIDEDGRSASALALGRSVSAPAAGSRSPSVDEREDEDAVALAIDDDDEQHSASCPEDKKRPLDANATRPPMRKRSKSSMTRSASSLLSPTSSSSPLLSSPTNQFLTIGSLLHPIENATVPALPGGGKPRSQSAVAAAGSGKKRSTRALFPAVSDADRRAKQRQIVKRCYYKKINTIKSLREEVTDLEDAFRAALRGRQQRDDTGAVSADAVQLRELYISTLDTKDALRKENRRLRRLADEYYMKNQGRLRQLLDANHKGLVLFTPAIEN